MNVLDTPPDTVLIVSLRYLGDALLATPIAHAIRQRWPQCAIDMMVFERSASMLEGNPDLRAVITIAERPPLPELLAQWRRLWRRYDLALIHQTGTRPLAYGWVAGRRVVGFAPAERSKAWWHRRLLDVAVPFEPRAPTVLENMRLLQAAGLDAPPTVVPPSARSAGAPPLSGDAAGAHGYAVLQPGPRTRYKRWTVDGWHQLIAHLQTRGLAIVISGGGSPEERAYVDQLLGGVDTTNIRRIDGLASLAQVADLIASARVFVGVDTGTTHVAAATGTPVIAIFGPTDPVIWGPWPARDGRPYQQVASEQTRGNVQLIQNPSLACVPCQQEGCDRHRDSYAACLDALPPAAIIAAVDRVLGASSS